MNEIFDKNESVTKVQRVFEFRKYIVLIFILFAIFIAFYKGFRVPNSWSTTYFQISVFDGIFRRSFLGTLLLPFGCYRFNYHLVSAMQIFLFFSFIFLLVWQGIKSRIGVLVGVFFLSTAGGFLFNALGYPEFFMYLLTAGAILLIRKGKYTSAAALGAVTLATHEMAIFTTIPLLVTASIFIERHASRKKIVSLLSPAIMLFAIQFAWFQTYPDGTIANYLSERNSCGYPLFRMDFMEIFKNSYSNTLLIYYSFAEKTLYIPLLAFLAISIGFSVCKKFDEKLVVFISIIIACLSPLLLGFVASDTNRWLTISFLNSLFIMLIASQLVRNEKKLESIIIGKIPFIIFILVAATLRVQYFDEFEPRSFDNSGFENFKNYMIYEIHKIPSR